MSPNRSAFSSWFFSIILLFSTVLLKLKTAESCRQEFLQRAEIEGIISNSIISSHNVISLLDCGFQCLRKEKCAGFGYKPPSNNHEINCQLTNLSTEHSYGDSNLEVDNAWIFYSAVNIVSPMCLINPCKNGGQCISDSCQTKGFSCKCGVKYEGKFCEVEKVFKSCKDVLQSDSSATNGIYQIKTDTASGKTGVYCQMTSLTGCSGGGWTMVIKINGILNTFEYDSPLWSNNQSYNIPGGLTAFDGNETKLPTYESTAFNEICIGLKVGNDLNFLIIHYPADSLYSLFADGIFRNISIGRQTWKAMISGSSLQTGCNQEGFNVKLGTSNFEVAWVRLGYVGNQENDCITPDSFIGVGGRAFNHGLCGGAVVSRNSAGNIARCHGDNGDKDIKAFGYILVR